MILPKPAGYEMPNPSERRAKNVSLGEKEEMAKKLDVSMTLLGEDADVLQTVRQKCKSWYTRAKIF